MFKLKIIDKPEMFKMKCNFEFPKIPIENLQEKEVNPTTEKQEIVADKEYSALSKVMINAVTSDIDSNIQSYNIKKDVSILGVTGNVIELNGEERATTPTKDTQIITPSADKNAITKMTVNPIPDEYIIPSGEIEITANGNYNVTDKASAKVNVPEKQLGAKTITKNGVYNATDDNVDGYSQVTVETSGVDINDYFNFTIRTSGKASDYIKSIPLIDTSRYTTLYRFFSGLSYLETIPLINTSNVTSMEYMFNSCNSLKSIPALNTSKVTNVESLCQQCQKLETIAELDFEKVHHINSSIFVNCAELKNVGGFLNLGAAFYQSANNYHHTVSFSSCTKLTHDSLMNVINNLYDIAAKGVATQQLIIGSTNLAKLTAEEIQIATDKGFSVS